MSELSRRRLLGDLGLTPMGRFLRAQQRSLPMPGYSTLLAAASCASLYLWWTKPKSVPEIHAVLGLLICWVGLAPSFDYLRRPRRPAMPLMPMTGLYYALAFGLPAFRDTSGAGPFDQVSSRALLLTLSGVAGFFVSYLFFMHLKIRPAVLPGIAAGGRLRLSLWVLMAVHLASVYIVRLGSLPSLGHVFTGGGLLAFGMFFWQYLEKRLTYTEVCFLALSLVAAMIPRIVSGFLWSVWELGMFLAAVFWAKRGKVPWGWMGAFLAFGALFNAAKAEYRSLTWGETSIYAGAGIVKKLEVFSEVMLGWVDRRSPLESARDSTEKMGERASMIGLFSYVAEQTPEIVPYWFGRTYAALFYKLVPRMLWAGKPVENLGYELTARYGMRDPGDITTSFNVPWIVELYVNFGGFGVITGMGLFGAIFAFLDGKLNQPAMPTLSLIAGLVILHDLWYQESNFSLMVGATVTLWGSFYVYFFLMLPAVHAPVRARA